MTSRRRVIPLFTLALLSLVAMSIVLSTRYDSQRHVLGVASQAFVISLPRRDTRRKDMHRLAKMMGSSWDFADAMDMANPAISRILTNLSEEVNIPFSWPEDIDYLATSNARLPSASSDLWHSSPAAATIAAPQTETCSKYDFTLSPYAAHTPDWLLLTPPRVACWQSHASVIRRIVDEGQHGPFVVLEDDVDMEKDIAQRLRSLWSLLPPDWDIVFLGHCWSNEAHHPPLASDDLPVFPRRQTRLHPSNAPKCTHAYALSRIGARRLLLHLRHAPFAYSRAIDQAFSWLVATKRLKSFSVVPSVVIQRKADSSDINTNTTKSWKDDLADGCFAR
ncbi:hypothetical protein HDZ31DRAFT_32719 [Schizophyllum fasciatum]